MRQQFVKVCPDAVCFIFKRVVAEFGRFNPVSYMYKATPWHAYAGTERGGGGADQTLERGR
jgi:hypothetical protein